MTSLAGRRLLVADPDASRAAAIAGVLAGLGAAVETTDGVNAALDLLESAERQVGYVLAAAVDLIPREQAQGKAHGSA